MDSQQVFTFGQQSLYMLLMISAPILLTVLAVGLVVSIFQAATQIHEATLSFLPAVLLLMTGFTRIVIVLSLLRQALGTQAAPPNQVVVGLSLFLTFFVMSPTIDKVYADAYQPYAENKIAFDEALKRGEVPMRASLANSITSAWRVCFIMKPRTGLSPRLSASAKSILLSAYGW